MKHRIAIILLLLLAVAGCLGGCSLVTSPIKRDMAAHLAGALLDSNDLQTVEQALPAYLLILEGLAEDSPHDSQLLQGTAMLYSLYAGLFIKDESRAQKMTDKSLGYALRAMQSRHPKAPRLRECSFEELRRFLAAARRKDVPQFYTLGAVWAGWIMVRQDDLSAIADLARIEMIMRRVIELDETFRDGGAHLYLGMLATLAPPHLGGKPEVGQKHFERAIALSKGNNLMARVMYARQCAKPLHDKALYDRLLNDILKADPNVKGYTLINTVAQQQARELLQAANASFEMREDAIPSPVGGKP